MEVKEMNKKIWGILICMLFIGVGVVPCISGNITKNTAPNSPVCFYDWTNYTLGMKSTDVDKDQIRYGVSWWGDSVMDYWTEYYPSGVEVKIDVKGKKETVDVVAEDIYGARSPIVNVLISPHGKSIELPIFNRFFEKLFEHFPFFEKIQNLYYN